MLQNLFDSHGHYDDPRFDEDRRELLLSMKDHGIVRLMNIGNNTTANVAGIELAKQYDFIYCTTGIHPDQSAEIYAQNSRAYLDVLAEQSKFEKCQAIGEIGLDYYYEDVPRTKQQEAFRLQMELARELDMPVIIHQRDAYEDTLKIVDQFPSVKGVFHCFSGSLEYAKEVVKRGWCVGFTGVITFKNARKAVEVAQWVPLDRLLIETDCPYMAPEPFRGRRCDSTMVSKMAEKIAQLRGLPVEQIAKITRENAMRVFRMEAPV